MSRGVIIAAAGVNGAGKSSIVGALHETEGAAYFNPDLRTRELVAAGLKVDDANKQAWTEGFDALRHAIDSNSNYTFETTLGGDSITSELLRALAFGREAYLYFVGLESAEMHIGRVKARVLRGGHDIPERKIRERFVSSHTNLLKFIGTKATIAIFDNSCEGEHGSPMPKTVLKIRNNRIEYPATADQLRATPDWAKAVVQLAVQRCELPAGLKEGPKPKRPQLRVVR